MTFDEYRAAVREADVGFTLTHREVAPWQLDYYPFGTGSLQFGADGGGSVSDGMVPNDKVVVVCKRGHAPSEIYLDGEPVGDSDFCFLGPGSHFIFSSQGPRKWLAVTLNAAAVLEAARSPALLHFLNRRTFIASSNDSEFTKVVGIAELLRSFLSRFDVVTPQQYEHRLVCDLVSTLARAAPERDRFQGDDCATFVRLVHSALECLRSSNVLNIRIDQLCYRLGVSERTLLRSFNRVVEIGPKKYLRLRQLNLIRVALRNAAISENRNVTDILTDCGISELGRVAGEYKLLFGETPSDTLKNSRLTYREQLRKSRCDGLASG